MSHADREDPPLKGVLSLCLSVSRFLLTFLYNKRGLWTLSSDFTPAFTPSPHPHLYPPRPPLPQIINEIKMTYPTASRNPE